MSAVQVRLWPPLLASLLVGCGDRCDALCATVAFRLDQCLQTETWEDLGAQSRLDWTIQCRQEWEDQRGDLAAREIELALDECQQAEPVAADLTCDEVRALYGP